ncbi:Tetratricopeptide repeat 31 [Brachionus plicatilis]|uniref:Tetratricopeptide repeat 31 n=1 Tax=Brachionus plicatilis TaxID=10195 RepID=A0A3M7RWX8_BRAPC|nr:Tetratricopeptide repeat 31 [Brachionus plicatilis]
MAISTEKAYETLNLPLGKFSLQLSASKMSIHQYPDSASKDAIEQSYKKLAVKWHPEKYTTSKNIQDAFKKFKSINLAFRKLIHNERNDKDITLQEMFEQYRQVFQNESVKKNKLINGQSQNGDIKNAIKNTLLELNNNNDFINNKNLNSQNNTNMSHKQIDQINKNHRLKVNDKNNNEENHENHFHLVRKEEQIEQTLVAKKMAQTLALRGNDLAKQGEFSKAVEKFTEAMKYDVNDQRLYGNRSYCFDKIGQFQEALNDANKAIAIEPLWAKGYFRKGRALYGLKYYKEAEEAYETVSTIENIDDPELEEELYKVRSLQLQEMGFSKTQSESAIKSYGTVQAALEAILACCDTDKSNESCSDIENNELDYGENEIDGEEVNPFAKKVEANTTSNTKLKSVLASSSIGLKIKTPGSQSSSSSTTNSIETEKFIEFTNNTKSSSNSNNQNSPSTSLWIGNVDPNVNEEMLSDLFSQYGQLSNVRCLPEKYCAFVNFKTKEDAQRAMLNLQGKNLEGQRILIKYPDNPNTAILGTLLAKNQSNNKTGNDKKIVNSQISNKTDNISKIADSNGLKLSGPVNGNECYFWRTTGCLYGDKCHYEHIKKNRGIDKKPWHK